MIKIKCPAKINLTLEVLNKREDGFHNIKSIMQMISLYDYSEIEEKKTKTSSIKLAGTSNEIPYNEQNLVWKAVDLFLKETGKKLKVDIFIEKNIPVAAGLAGGSTDAAGALFGLNEITGQPLNEENLNKLCAMLGSDLNVCLQGGCILATSRGEITQKLPVIQSSVTLIKPKYLGISAGEAYKKYAAKKFKPQNNMTEKMIDAINKQADVKPFLYNDLAYAVFNDYPELQKIKSMLSDSIMSGSGSTYFVLENLANTNFGADFQVINNLEFISCGVSNIS